MPLAPPEQKSLVQRYVPVVDWLPTYNRGKLFRWDVIAGLTVWALLVPEAMAYAGIAGVPPEVGLYTAPLALLGYAVFGTSRQLFVGPSWRSPSSRPASWGRSPAAIRSSSWR